MADGMDLAPIRLRLAEAFPEAEKTAVAYFDAGNRIGIAVSLANGKRNAIRVPGDVPTLDDDLELAIQQLRAWVDEEV